MATLRALLERRAPWFRAKTCNLLCCREARFEYRLARAFGKGRVFLAGDACHTTSPVGVQSMNVGFREVTELCRSLVEVLSGKGADGDLRAYSAGRPWEWAQLLGVSGLLHSAPAATDDWMRHRAERIAACIPASGEHFSQLVSQIGFLRAPDDLVSWSRRAR
jgi:2-polyprenyl-6-methoxyphenol hydroxylase-like FAD-dependent oxidoreductase